eukprot:764989-Hanusia_phi.AAC.3
MRGVPGGGTQAACGSGNADSEWVLRTKCMGGVGMEGGHPTRGVGVSTLVVPLAMITMSRRQGQEGDDSIGDLRRVPDPSEGEEREKGREREGEERGKGREREGEGQIYR